MFSRHLYSFVLAACVFRALKLAVARYVNLFAFPPRVVGAVVVVPIALIIPLALLTLETKEGESANSISWQIIYWEDSFVVELLLPLPDHLIVGSVWSVNRSTQFPRPTTCSHY